MAINIQNTKDINTKGKFRFLVYGSSGAGKTKLISTLPKRTLILDTDKGLKTIRSLTVDYVTASSWKEVVEFLDYIKTDECKAKYDWLVFDTITAIFDYYLNDLSEKENKKDKPDKFAIWAAFLSFALKFFTLIREQQFYHTLTLSQMLEKEDASGILERAPSIPGQAKNRVPEFFDEVYALRVDKDGARFLQTLEDKSWKAKSRSNCLEAKEEADLGVIMKKIIGG